MSRIGKIVILLWLTCVFLAGTYLTWSYEGGYQPIVSLVGSNTFSGIQTILNKIVLDAVGGNSYIIGRTNDMIQFFTNGTKTFEIGTSSITASQSIYSQNTNYFGTRTDFKGDTYTYGMNIQLDSASDIYTLKPDAIDSKNILELSDTSTLYQYNIAAKADPTFLFRSGNCLSTQTGRYGMLFGSTNRFCIDTGSQTASIDLRINGVKGFQVTASTISYTTRFVIKSLTSGGLLATTPVVVGELYYNSTTKKLCVSTGTSAGQFGSMAIGTYSQ
jgi:hypothetical protein